MTETTREFDTGEPITLYGRIDAINDGLSRAVHNLDELRAIADVAPDVVVELSDRITDLMREILDHTTKIGEMLGLPYIEELDESRVREGDFGP